MTYVGRWVVGMQANTNTNRRPGQIVPQKLLLFLYTVKFFFFIGILPFTHYNICMKNLEACIV